MSAVTNDMDAKPMVLVNIAANHNHWLGMRFGERALTATGSRACDTFAKGTHPDTGSQQRIELYLQQRFATAFRIGRHHCRRSRSHFLAKRPRGRFLSVRSRPRCFFHRGHGLTIIGHKVGVTVATHQKRQALRNRAQAK